MNNAVIIQARVGSTRLRAKVLKNLCGKTVLEHVVARVQQAKLIDGIIIVTTTKKEDDVIVQLANKLNVKVFRGSENDVLDRYYQAAERAQKAYRRRFQQNNGIRSHRAPETLNP